MLSIRTLARASAPRAAMRMATNTTSAASLLARPAAAAAAKPAAVRALSSTTARWAKAAQTETDEELSAKLDSEIQIEEDMKASEQEPASVRDFLANTPFELVDTPGKEVVKLVRQYNDEK